MNGKQHLLFTSITGTALYLGAMKGIDPNLSMMDSSTGAISYSAYCLSSMIGSLLPDIDCEESLFGNKIISNLFPRHRSYTHSLVHIGVFLILLSISVFIMGIFIPLPPWVYKGLFGFIYGIISHLFLDSLTVSGIPLFWKKKHFEYVRTTKNNEDVYIDHNRNIHLLPENLRPKSGKKGSSICTIISAILLTIIFMVINPVFISLLY